MMNPQFPPLGQNNNAPTNPLGYPPTSQTFNGENANVYSQMPPNGPQKPFDQNDMSQKMQSMHLNGPPVPTSQIPPGQFPPGVFPPTSSFPGQPKPSVSSQFPTLMGSLTSGPGPVPTSHAPFGQPPHSQSQNSQFPPSMPQRPPSVPGQGPPTQSHAPQQLPSQGGQPQQVEAPHGGMRQMQPDAFPQLKPGLPSSAPPPQPAPQGGHHTLYQNPIQPHLPQNMPPNSRAPGQPGPPQGMAGPGQGPPHPGMPPQPGYLSQMPGQPGQPPQSGQTGLPPQQLGPRPGQPGMPPLPGQPGLPPQHRQMGSMAGQQGPMSGQQGQMPGQQGPVPGQQGLKPGQQGSMPGQQGQMPGQQGQMPGQQGQMPGQQGPMLGQLGPMPGPPAQTPGQPGLSMQLGQPGLPPQQQQPGIPGQPGGYSSQLGFTAGQLGGQPGGPQPPMSGLPHMPPPLSQQRQFSGMPATAAGPPGPPGPPTSGGHPGMPPMGGQAPGYAAPGSGYPPQYQQPQQPQFPGQQPGYPQYQQPPQKKLDPDQMPSPIQVMADDQQNRGGIFVTNDKGLVPPLVSTDFIVDDKGNASPRYIRSSMYSVPVTADLLKQTAMPFCVVVSPLAEPVGAEPPPPLVDFAAATGSPAMGPVRCSRCKAYICPNMKFVDAGRHFHCAFCKATTEVPMEYTQYINSMQQYGRLPPELALGAYEILATKEYCRNNTLPNPPAIVFVIDVSYNSIKSGLLDTICANVMDIIAAMPKDEQTGKSWTRVGFITYSSTVHFYNIKGSLAQPQMLSVGDVGDMFVPLLEGFLALPEDSGPVLQALLQQLPALCRDHRETETILLPAVQAGLEALKAADTSGQLLVFHTTLPSYNAPGKLINREDRKLLGTDKEKTILSPANTSYNEVGQACSAAGVSVELFVCNQAYVDVATIGQLPRLTGGQIRKYTYFTAELDGPRLVADVKRVAARATAHDAVMRLRTSTGVRATDFYGHLFMSNTTDVELAAIDADKAIGIEIKHDDKLTGEDGVYLQAALLYTHRGGQRRLRVLNLALHVAHQLADVYRSVELDTCVNFLTKQAVWSLRELGGRAVREALSARCARSLAAYRRHCASPSSAGQLVLPESMKLLPLYTSCVLRGDALAGGPDLSCDERSCAMFRALAADVPTSLVYTYPRLLAVHRAPPVPLRASLDKMADHGVYLLENGVHILLWVGSQASPEFVQDVFGVPSPQQIDTQVTELPVLDTAASEMVRNLVHDARVLRRNAMRLTVMRQHDKLETVLRHFLVEDRGVDGSASYVDYLCHVHKEIRALL